MSRAEYLARAQLCFKTASSPTLLPSLYQRESAENYMWFWLLAWAGMPA